MYGSGRCLSLKLGVWRSSHVAEEYPWSSGWLYDGAGSTSSTIAVDDCEIDLTKAVW